MGNGNCMKFTTFEIKMYNVKFHAVEPLTLMSLFPNSVFEKIQ